jgi:hypothetical protein
MVGVSARLNVGQVVNQWGARQGYSANLDSYYTATSRSYPTGETRNIGESNSPALQNSDPDQCTTSPVLEKA